MIWANLVIGSTLCPQYLVRLIKLVENTGARIIYIDISDHDGDFIFRANVSHLGRNATFYTDFKIVIYLCQPTISPREGE